MSDAAEVVSTSLKFKGVYLGEVEMHKDGRVTVTLIHNCNVAAVQKRLSCGGSGDITTVYIEPAGYDPRDVGTCPAYLNN